MDAKMQSYAAQSQADIMQAKLGAASLGDAGVHVDHLLAMLSDVQSDALVLRQKLHATRSTAGEAATSVDTAAIKVAMQETLQKLRTIQDDIAAQQARLSHMGDDATGEQGSRHTGAKARMADSVRAQQSEQQAHVGMRAVTQLHTSPAAGSGLGDNLGQEMPREVQMPGGEREGLDGIVTMVGGMLRASGEPAIAGKQPRATQIAWQAQPKSVPLDELQERWGQYVTEQVHSRKSPESMDINQLIQWVMREAYIGNTQDLRSHATRVEYYTQLKAQIRLELNRAREFRSKHRTGEGDKAKLDAPFDLNHVSLDPDVSPDGHWGTRPAQPDGTTESLEDLDAYIKKLDNSLSTVGDDGQAAQLDLQNLSQKQAQLINMLSNLSKAMHDTAMSIIRKIGN